MTTTVFIHRKIDGQKEKINQSTNQPTNKRWMRFAHKTIVDAPMHRSFQAYLFEFDTTESMEAPDSEFWQFQ